MGLRFIVDVSSYQNLSDDQWRILIDAGLGGVILKSSQGLFQDSMLERHLEKMAKFSIGYGFYHFTDILKDPKKQADLFLGLIQKYKPKSAWADDEMYWTDWALYWEALLKKNGVYVPRMAADKIYQILWTFQNYLHIGLKGSNVAEGIYSAPWFNNGYCPKLAGLINSTPYYWNVTPRIFVDVDKDQRLDPDEIPVWFEKLKFYDSDLPRGVTRGHVHIRQLAAVVIQGVCDIDFNVMTDEAHAVLFGDMPPAPPDDNEIVLTPGKIYYRVVTDTLNIRSSPKVAAGNDTGDLRSGQVVEVYEIAGTDAWARIGPDQWACIKKGTAVYMERIDVSNGSGLGEAAITGEVQALRTDGDDQQPA